MIIYSKEILINLYKLKLFLIYKYNIFFPSLKRISMKSIKFKGELYKAEGKYYII